MADYANGTLIIQHCSSKRMESSNQFTHELPTPSCQSNLHRHVTRGVLFYQNPFKLNKVL